MKAVAEIQLDPRDHAAIREAARILRERFAVDEVILFGSKARGEDDPESDIDLLVLTSRQFTRQERHAIVDALFPIQLEYDVVLSPLVVAAENWRSGIVSVLPIHAEVEEQGVAV
jgi:uncharacterized protein